MELLKIKDYIRRQFDVLGFEEGRTIVHVIRIIDGIEFTLDDPIFENRIKLKNGLEVNEEIEIEWFYNDQTHVQLSAWHFTDDYECVSGLTEKIPINDIERIMFDILKASKKKFKDNYCK